MKPAVIAVILLNCAVLAAWSQPADVPPKFAAADVHVSAKSTNPFVRTSPVRNGRYEIKLATMVDLIHTAYSFDADKVLGGPSWLETDRYDVIAKVPEDTNPESLKLMLQALLADRFHLVVHNDTRPLPTYALSPGKKPQLKPADAAEETGCKPRAGSPQTGGVRMMRGNPDGSTTVINLGPGMTVQYGCRNMTMAAFAEGLRSMAGNAVGANPVLDRTGLKGSWNFDITFSMQLFGGPMMDNATDRVSIFEAVDKQLGLKLEEIQVPTPVVVVDRVNRTPAGNPPETAELLPPIPVPTEFEVASVKPTDTTQPMMSRFQMQPGGRLTAQGMPLRFMISRAFNTNNNDQIVGLPKWVDTDRFDIIAKAPSSGPATATIDPDALAPMMRNLLVDRFKMKYHTEEQPVSAYSLVAAKPKMKKADPESRTSCRSDPAPPPAAAGAMLMTCHNTTMAQFAERLQNISSELTWPILDATELAGGWDFTFTFSRSFGVAIGGGRGGDGPAAGAPAASDPTGTVTIFQAIERQLGLKLELQKRPMPVIVIDHLEEKPTEN